MIKKGDLSMSIPLIQIHPHCGKRLDEVRDPATYLKDSGLNLSDSVFCNGCASDYSVTELKIDESGKVICPTEEDFIQCEYPLEELIVVQSEAHLRALREHAAPQWPF
jgi:hypothetical protein